MFGKVLLIAILLIGFGEIFSIVFVSSLIGFFNTFLILVIDVLLGVYFVKKMARLGSLVSDPYNPNTIMNDQDMPVRLGVMGVLFLFPGFVSDFLALVIGLTYLFPSLIQVVFMPLFSKLIMLYFMKSVGISPNNLKNSNASDEQMQEEIRRKIFEYAFKNQENKKQDDFPYDESFKQQEVEDSSLEKVKKQWAQQAEIKDTDFTEFKDDQKDKK